MHVVASLLMSNDLLDQVLYIECVLCIIIHNYAIEASCQIEYFLLCTREMAPTYVRIHLVISETLMKFD